MFLSMPCPCPFTVWFTNLGLFMPVCWFQVNLNGVAIFPGSDVQLKLVPSVYTYTEPAKVCTPIQT
jgi:hypothetical protein